MTWCRRQMADDNSELAGVPFRVAVESSAGCSWEAYLSSMVKGPDPHDRSTWGGAFELSCLGQRWGCIIHVFRADLEGWRLTTTSVGAAPERAALKRHRGRICLAWSGGHYDVLVMESEELLAALEAQPSS